MPDASKLQTYQRQPLVVSEAVPQQTVCPFKTSDCKHCFGHC